MWEEYLEYQKAQAKMIGVALVLLLIAGIVYCISEREWQLLRQVLLFAGAFVSCVALLSGTAWMIVRIITRRSRSDSRLNHNQDA